MYNPRLAHRYAKSVLNLSKELGELESSYEDFQLMDRILNQSREFRNLLRSPIVRPDKKKAVFDAILGNHIRPLTKKFFDLLVRKNREAALPEIASAFIAQYKEDRHIVIVELTTATPASPALVQRVEERVLAVLPEGSRVEIRTKVVEDIVGGFILEFNHNLVDASIRRDLQDVKSQFRKNIYIGLYN